MRLHYLQHDSFEGPAQIGQWALQHGHHISGTRFEIHEPLPCLEEIDWLVIMGGPMNIYEEHLYPWLIAEKAFIAQAIEHGKRVLGVCLGAQLIADVLGGRVTRNPHTEIGWFPISLTPVAATTAICQGFPSTFPAFHWHGDTFEIPAGCTHLAESDGCINQAFSYQERVVGLQFHLESSLESVQLLLDHFSHELIPDLFVQSLDEIHAGMTHITATNQVLYQLLDNMAQVS